MIFVTTLKAIPGNYNKWIKAAKHPKLPVDIKIREYLATFGSPDCLIVFEAPNEAIAAEFVVQFGEVAECTTLVGFPVDELKWTH